VKAGELLSAAGLDLPTLCAELHPVDPNSVRVRSAPWVMRKVWPEGIAAMALPRRVYLSPDLLASDANRVKYLLVHELVHVRQWSDYGFFGFLRRYLGEYLRGRRQGLGHKAAYLNNRLEGEARDTEERYRDISR
jgi:hypothetical protein